MAGHVFISYSRVDTRYVKELAAHLAAAGLPVWMDDAIDYGDRWLKVIREQIDTAGVVVVVMTPASEDSAWVTREISRAEGAKVPILPLLRDGSVFFQLSDVQHEDVSDGRMPPPGFSAKIRKLLAGGTPTAPATAPSATAPAPLALRHRRTLSGHTGIVTTVAWSPDSRTLASGGSDSLINLWDAESGVPQQGNLPEHDGTVWSLAWCASAGDHWDLASGSADRTVILSRVDGTDSHVLTDHAGDAWSVAWSVHGGLLAVADGSAVARVWTVPRGRFPVPQLTSHALVDPDQPGHTGRIRAVAWAQTPGYDPLLATVGDDGTVRIWDAVPQPPRQLRSEHPHRRVARAVAWSPDGTRVLSGGDDYLAHILAVDGGAPLSFTGHTDRVRAVAWAPDGRAALTGSWDNTARVWDPDTGTTLDTITVASPVRAVAWSPDGTRIAVAWDTKIDIWSVG